MDKMVNHVLIMETQQVLQEIVGVIVLMDSKVPIVIKMQLAM